MTIYEQCSYIILACRELEDWNRQAKCVLTICPDELHGRAPALQEYDLMQVKLLTVSCALQQLISSLQSLAGEARLVAAASYQATDSLVLDAVVLSCGTHIFCVKLQRCSQPGLVHCANGLGVRATYLSRFVSTLLSVLQQGQQ